MSKTMTVSDFQTTYFEIIDAAMPVEKNRYTQYQEAKTAAEKANGKVVKVIKRMVETMEFEKVI